MVKPKIVVVDDERLITAQLEEQLTSMGYKVVGVGSSGEEAIKLAMELKPDLILMDIVMPNGKIDGIKAAKKIKTEFDIPVIFITAYGGGKIINEVKDVEPFGFIIKPFQESELKVIIEMALYRKEMERELKASEEKYRSVVDTAIEAIITIDIHMNIFFWNRAAEMMFGYSASEAIGNPFTFIVPERLHKQLQTELDRMVLTEETNPVAKITESIGLRKDGSEFPMEFSLASWIIRDEIFFTIIVRDITERKKIEQMKSDFVSLVSHQLRTPAVEIIGCIDNMLDGLTGKLTKKQRKYLEVMKEISARNYRLISDLLNVSRIERGVISVDIKKVDLKNVIEAVLKEYREFITKKGLELKLVIPDEEIFVMADEDKTVESISNIVDNAIKFTDKGSIKITVGKNKEFGTVEISDTGVGIPKEILNKLLKKEQIFRGPPTARGGAGLGLYIAKKFMILQNGDISIVSQVNKGSTFTCKIPLARLGGKNEESA